MQSSVLFVRISLFIGIALAISSVATFGIPRAEAAEACVFTKTLEMGVIDESVLCLQKYLNANGFEIASEGPGSLDNETNKFGLLTEQAVKRWQEAKAITPAMGIFGTKSQAVYKKDITGVASDTTSDTSPLAMADSLTALLDQALQSAKVTAEPTVAGVSVVAKSDIQDNTEGVISDAMKMIIDTQEEIEDLRESDPDEAADIADDVRDAMEQLFEAIGAYFEGDYEMAEKVSLSVLEDVTESYEDAGGESMASEAEDTIDDVNDLYAEIEELLDEADADGEDVGEAPEMLELADELLTEAEEQFEKRVYKQSISDALDAEELLEDARDEIDVDSDSDVESAVEEAWDEFSEAEEEIGEAEEDGEDVEEAQDLLNDAERRLKKADIALDDEEHNDAADYAEEAEEMIEEALDAIGGDEDEDEADAEEVLDDAWQEYKSVKNDVEEAEDAGEDMDDARDYLDEAEGLLEDADDAFDDEDYDAVLDLIDEALDLVGDAEDEL